MAEIRVGVVPLGHIPEIVPKTIAAHILGLTGLSTDMHPALDTPEYALDKNRFQYNAGHILTTLEEKSFPDYDKVIAILEVDIFVPIFTHVFGEAKQGGKVALVSLYRLGRNLDVFVPPLSLERGSKVALHELGHLFSLVHCMNENCLMHFSGGLQNLDRSPLYFCRYCITYLVPERKLSFSPISASDSNFNPRNTQCIPAVKIFVFLDLNEKS